MKILSLTISLLLLAARSEVAGAQPAFGDGPVCVGNFDVHETQNLSPIVAAGNVACVQGEPDGQYSADNIFARVYTVPSDRVIVCVEAAIEVNSGVESQDVTLRVRRLDLVTTPPQVANTTILASFTQGIAGDLALARIGASFSPGIPVAAGEVIIVEMGWDLRDPATDTVGALFPGGNELGQTAPTYVLANECELPDYVDLADLGFADQAVILDYYANLVSVVCPADISGPAGAGNPDGNVDGDDYLLLIAQWGSPCAGSCEADITGPNGMPDGNVDSLDFLLLISQWGSPGNCPWP
jgi:hypothetical protein